MVSEAATREGDRVEPWTSPFRLRRKGLVAQDKSFFEFRPRYRMARSRRRSRTAVIAMKFCGERSPHADAQSIKQRARVCVEMEEGKMERGLGVERERPRIEKVLDTFWARGGKIAIFRARFFYLLTGDLVDIGMPIAIILD